MSTAQPDKQAQKQSAVKQALFAIKDLRAKLNRAEKQKQEPIAIVGMACRFPGGADTPEKYWEMLSAGTNCVREVPAERWDAERYFHAEKNRPGKIYARWGGFLQEDLRKFDPKFFGISPREAAGMDPQQRILLEVSWEALEAAGIPPRNLKDTKTGVYVGVMNQDYYHLLMRQRAVRDFDAYTGTGSIFSVTAGRISYVLGLQGPSLAVDTACSSSLVTVHEAMRSLRLGESDLALAGGVNLFLTPETYLVRAQANMLSPTGRCHTFDASADGYVPGEGCGIVVLKRLSDAIEAGDEIQAVIRASAVNHDGASSGLTVPNGGAQQRLIREALKQAGVEPADVGYIEAHGTGTPLGDPIEVNALSAVLGKNRPVERPLHIGSVKTNIGHLESAAGIAGLMKVALSLRNRKFAPHLNFNEVNPRISLDEIPAKIPGDLTDWPLYPDTERRLGGVSSFALNGTNAHILLEEAPEPASDAADAAPVRSADAPALLAISAASNSALADSVLDFRDLLTRSDDAQLHDICYTAARRRSLLDHRLFVAGKGRDDLIAQLGAFRADEDGPQFFHGHCVQGEDYRLAFAFAGQGSQWNGMGQRLYAGEAVFRDTIDEIDGLLAKHADWSLRSIFDGSSGAPVLAETRYAQPAIFALQVGLFRLYASHGIKARAVVGHSLGEVAAAHAAGVLSLAEAVRVIYHRARLMQDATGLGKMAAIGMPMEDARALLSGYESKVAIGAYNSPGSIVLSGEGAALQEILGGLPEHVFQKMLPVDYAFHSPQMEPFRKELEKELADLQVQKPTIPIFSTVTGKRAEESDFTAVYWGRNMRNSVSFAPAIQAMGAANYNVYLEVGPHAVLSVPIQQCLEESERPPVVLPSLRRDEDDHLLYYASLGGLVASGIEWNASAVYASGRLSSLPANAWQREDYWLEHFDTDPGAGAARGGDDLGHPFLGSELRAGNDSTRVYWENDLDTTSFPYIEDHKIGGAVVVPGTAYLEMVHAAAARYFGSPEFALYEVDLLAALILVPGESVRVQIEVNSAGDGSVQFALLSRPASSASWTEHVRGRLQRTGDANAEQADALRFPALPGEGTTLAEIQSRLSALDVDQFYEGVKRFGNDYGPAFRGVWQAWRSDVEVLTEVVAPDEITGSCSEYRFHPALFDAALHAFIAPLAFRESGENLESSFMPVHLGSVRIYSEEVGPRVMAHAITRRDGEQSNTVSCDFQFRDDAGHVVAEILGVRVRLLEESGGADAARPPQSEWLHSIQWDALELDLAAPKKPGKTFQKRTTVIVPDQGGFGAAFAAVCEQVGAKHKLVGEGEGLLAALEAVGGAARIVDLRGLDLAAGDALNLKTVQETALQRGVGPALADMQQVLEWDGVPPECWLVTAGAQPVQKSEELTSPMAATLWGFGRTMAVENPAIWGGLIDLPADLSAAGQIEHIAGQLFAVLHGAPEGEDQLAVREDQVFAARLTQQRFGDEQPISFRADASYLVTGGFGALGLRTAQWMATRGARRVILMGRTPLPPRKEWARIQPDDRLYERIQGVRQLEALGVAVHMVAADSGDAAAVHQFVEDFEAEGWPSIRGVMHAAGLGVTGMIAELDQAELAKEYQAKVSGAWILHEVFAERELDFRVYFSSASAVLSSPRMGGYASANTFMDALAHYQRSRGLKATSINWGFWADAGMAVRDAGEDAANLAPKGMGAFTAAEAFEVQTALMGVDPTQLTVMPFSIAEWAKYYSSSASSPFFARLRTADMELTAPKEAGAASAAGDFRSTLEAMAPGDREAALREHLQGHVAGILRMNPEDVDARRPVGELGMDSLMTIEFRNRLQKSLSISLSATVFFNYPTVQALVPHLAQKMKLSFEGEASTAAAATETPLPQSRQKTRKKKTARPGTGKRQRHRADDAPGGDPEALVRELSESEAESMLLDELSRFE